MPKPPSISRCANGKSCVNEINRIRSNFGARVDELRKSNQFLSEKEKRDEALSEHALHLFEDNGMEIEISPNEKFHVYPQESDEIRIQITKKGRIPSPIFKFNHLGEFIEKIADSRER